MRRRQYRSRMFRINLALACISQWEARTILHGRHVPMEQIYKKMDRQATKNVAPYKKRRIPKLNRRSVMQKKTRGAIIQRSMTCHTSSCHDSPRQISLLYQPANSTVKYTSPPPAAATSASGEATPISPPFAASDVSWSVRAFRGHSPASRGTTAGCPATGYRTSYPSSPPRRLTVIHALRA